MGSQDAHAAAEAAHEAKLDRDEQLADSFNEAFDAASRGEYPEFYDNELAGRFDDEIAYSTSAIGRLALRSASEQEQLAMVTPAQLAILKIIQADFDSVVETAAQAWEGVK